MDTSMYTGSWASVATDSNQMRVRYRGSTPVTTYNGDTYWVRWKVDDATIGATGLPYKPGPSYTYADLEESWYDGAAAIAAQGRELSKGHDYQLPDGGLIKIDDKGNYVVEDKDAKVTYEANRIREFSPHLNASDLIAEFVKYAGKCGVSQAEVLQLPLELFISWLVIEATERDNDPIPEGIVPVDRQLRVLAKPKCLSCGRFIPRLHSRNRFPFCDPAHAVRRLKRLA